MVPTTAVDVRGTSPSVMRVRGGKAEKVQIVVGVTDKSSETIEVLSGLQAGDTLLLGAAQGITPGTPVRVSAPAAGSAAPASTAKGS